MHEACKCLPAAHHSFPCPAEECVWVFFGSDGLHDEGGVTPAGKQNQCWSVSQGTFTTPSGVSKAALPLSAHLTITKDPPSEHKGEKNHAKPHSNGLAPLDWSLHRVSHHIPLTTLARPSLMGDSTNAATIRRVSSENNHRSSHVKDDSAVHITATTRRSGRARQRRTFNFCSLTRAPAEKSARSHPPRRPGRRATVSCGHRSL